jgi:hypothetical protein
MNCCEYQTCLEDRKKTVRMCDAPSCQAQSHPVTVRTMFLMLKPELFDQLSGDNQYRFCASPHCPVVYFSADRCFRIDDLRIRVGLKEKDDPIPLCYCFGFTEEHVRHEIETTGGSTIHQHIKSLIKEGMCACEERNPSGMCCLGEVARAEHRFLKERK